MKIYISAHAESLSNIRYRLTDHATQIVENFVKLQLGYNLPTRNHWQHEIFTQLHSIQLPKGSKKYPATQKIYKWLYTDQLPELQDQKRFHKMLASICSTEQELPTVLRTEELAIQTEIIAKLDRYYAWIAEELSEYGYVTQQDIYSILDELF